MKRLIVNADDLGRSAGINAGIFEAHRSGIVTSATLMVNYPSARGVRALSAEAPALGIGLHLALTGGIPTLPPSQVRSLVDAKGNLPAKPEGHGNLDPREVLAEARAQLARFRELIGRGPTHFDSHHHSHRLPAVFDALCALARETGVPVRCAAPGMAAQLRSLRVKTTDAFVEGFFGDAASLETLLRILGELPEGATELMCHPARVDDELRNSSSYANPRERELSVLTSEAARAAVAGRGIELVRFSDL